MSKNGNGHREEIPIAVSVAQFAEQVRGHLTQAQSQRLNLELLQLSNDHKDTDRIPGEQPKMGDNGQPLQDEDGQLIWPTYGEYYALFDGRIARLIERAERRPGVMALIRKQVKAEQAQAEAEAATAEAEEELIES